MLDFVTNVLYKMFHDDQLAFKKLHAKFNHCGLNKIMLRYTKLHAVCLIQLLMKQIVVIMINCHMYYR